jgi:hypothetical protein
MNNHSHKEPPLQDKVNHRKDIISRIQLLVASGFFVSVVAHTIASVFD